MPAFFHFPCLFFFSLLVLVTSQREKKVWFSPVAVVSITPAAAAGLAPTEPDQTFPVYSAHSPFCPPYPLYPLYPPYPLYSSAAYVRRPEARRKHAGSTLEASRPALRTRTAFEDSAHATTRYRVPCKNPCCRVFGCSHPAPPSPPFLLLWLPRAPPSSLVISRHLSSSLCPPLATRRSSSQPPASFVIAFDAHRLIV